MLRQDQISAVINTQKEDFLAKDSELVREALSHIPVISSYATIITGVRRCGKSTLLLQVMRDRYKDALYLNFEDIRLTGFETSDFTRLHQEILTRKNKVIFLDEIQLADKWEIFVNQLLREGYTIFVTGSNASMLSRELGTHLTGRHVSMELFPFSYSEFVSYKGYEFNSDSLYSYLHVGGFPEYVKNENTPILTNLMEDILVRDIAVRHGVRDTDSLKQLALYLISNVGKPVSANQLTGIFGIKSSTTLLEYFSYFRDAYLIEFLPQFSFSKKAQARNPKKIYAIDPGLITILSTSFTEDVGRRLENLIYLHLRHSNEEFYYYKDKGECDFVVIQKSEATQAIQVCYRIEDTNWDRELSGLLEAMKFFNLSEGTIVTFEQKDAFDQDGYFVQLIPAHEYLSGN